MRLTKLPFIILLAGAALAASPAAAQEDFATVTTALNARSGPSTAYAVLFVMPAGANVGVLDCPTPRTWCQVSYSGRIGWASARYLRFGGVAVSGDPDPVVVNPGAVTARTTVTLNMRRGPSTAYAAFIAIPAGATVRVTRCVEGYVWCEVVYAGYTGWVAARYLQYGQQSITIAGPRIGLQLTLNFGQQPPPPQVPSRACFYGDWDLAGPSFCLNPGQDLRSLDANWNDRISSIRIEGGAEVLACEHFDYDGRCATYRTSVGRLTGANDVISSIRVR